MRHFVILVCIGILTLAGCQENRSTDGRNSNSEASGADAKIQASLDKLAPEDRALAEAQKVCPVTDQLLGSMGVPIKVTLNDQPVFLCCSACIKAATQDADKTLAKVAQLKESNAKKPGNTNP